MEIPWAKVQYSITQLGAATRGGGSPMLGYATYPGGLDLITPSMDLQNGALRAGQNFECALQGGYSRIQGYERFDGRPSPSDASFTVVQVSSFTNVPSVGDAITQSGSGATGTVAAVSNNPGAFYMIVTKTSGTFASSGTITKAGPVTIGTTTTTTVALSALQNAQYSAAAADIYRADITAVPGSGDVLGVVCCSMSGVDRVFAFRANAGGTAVDLYRASGTGWTQVPFLNIVEFTAGGASTPPDGVTLTQGAVSAVVRRVMQRTGDWTGSTAAGGLVIDAPTGGNFAAGAATLTGGISVTLSGAQTAITMLPGGRFEFAKGNFYGTTATYIYGCDGVNKAFEFDGTTLAPITTGLPTDAPQHVAIHRNYLMLTYGTNLINSGPGLPFKYAAVDGGGSLAVNDLINGIITLPGNQSTATLAIFQQSNTSFLYGNSASTWQLITYNTGVGARAYSIQNMFDTFSFDDFGVNTLQTTLNFGNFSSSALTRAILPLIIQDRASITASCISRTKGQYRVFFRDGSGLYMTVANQTYLGAIPVLFPNVVLCADNDKSGTGNEISYFGSSNGFVYQLDKGTGFDGGDIFAYITTAWDMMRSPRVLKRFRAASMEISATNYVALSFGYQLGYGTPQIIQPTPTNFETPFSAAPQWDSFTWDNFTWDGLTLSPTDVDMTGMGENIQVTIQSSTNYIDSYQINSIIYHFTPRRGLRV